MIPTISTQFVFSAPPVGVMQGYPLRLSPISTASNRRRKACGIFLPKPQGAIRLWFYF